MPDFVKILLNAFETGYTDASKGLKNNSLVKTTTTKDAALKHSYNAGFDTWKNYDNSEEVYYNGNMAEKINEYSENLMNYYSTWMDDYSKGQSLAIRKRPTSYPDDPIEKYIREEIAKRYTSGSGGRRSKARRSKTRRSKTRRSKKSSRK